MRQIGARMRPARRSVTIRLNSSGSSMSDQSRPISWSRARSRARAWAASRWRTVSSWGEVVGAGLVALAHRGGIAERGEDDDGQRGPQPLADAQAGLEAVHAGHAHVEQDEVEGLVDEPLQRLLARFGPLGVLLVERQQVHQRAGDVRVVVDDEDARHGHRPARSAPGAFSAV
jgi:hypothetical protein